MASKEKKKTETKKREQKQRKQKRKRNKLFFFLFLFSHVFFLKGLPFHESELVLNRVEFEKFLGTKLNQTMKIEHQTITQDMT